MRHQLENSLTTQLDRAAAICAGHGAKLTDIRRAVLALIVQNRHPIGAYTLLDRLKIERANAAPVTIYRALDFLQENGLIHRIERLNAFIACSDQGEHQHHGQPVQFLICRSCGAASEIEDSGIAGAVLRATEKAGFRAEHTMIEVEGLCRECSAGG